MDRKNPAANFKLVVDGKSLSYSDAIETALEDGIFLKERQLQSEIVVRDMTNRLSSDERPGRPLAVN